jgi:hypothetical protein
MENIEKPHAENKKSLQLAYFDIHMSKVLYKNTLLFDRNCQLDRFTLRSELKMRAYEVLQSN